MSDSGIPKIRNAIVLGPARPATPPQSTRAGLDGLVERRLSVGDPGRCKPHPDAYRYAADSCGVPLQRSAMLGVHPWDLPGATAVCMTTGWIDRHGTPWPPVCTPPTVPARTLGQVALGLVGR